MDGGMGACGGAVRGRSESGRRDCRGMRLVCPFRRTVSGACRDERMSDALRSAGVHAHVWNPDDGEGCVPKTLEVKKKVATHNLDL